MGKISKLQEGNKFKFIVSGYALIGFLAGLILSIWPEETINFICYVIGFSLIFFGGSKTIGYFRQKENVSFYKFGLVVGVACTAVGIFIIIKPDVIASFFPLVLSLIIIISSLVKLQSAADLQRNGYEKWWIVLILAILGIGLGLTIMFNSFGFGMFLTRFIGIVLMLNSAMDIFSFFCVSKRMREMNKTEE